MGEKKERKKEARMKARDNERARDNKKKSGTGNQPSRKQLEGLQFPAVTTEDRLNLRRGYGTDQGAPGRALVAEDAARPEPNPHSGGTTLGTTSAVELLRLTSAAGEPFRKRAKTNVASPLPVGKLSIDFCVAGRPGMVAAGDSQ